MLAFTFCAGARKGKWEAEGRRKQVPAYLRAKGKLTDVLVEKFRGLSNGLLPAAHREREREINATSEL